MLPIRATLEQQVDVDEPGDVVLGVDQKEELLFERVVDQSAIRPTSSSALVV